MKNKPIGILLMATFFVLQSCCFSGCPDDEPFIPTSNYEPIVLTREAFEQSVILQNSKPIEVSGKIYVIEEFLFVNEKREGFHLFDNSNPANPIASKFLNVPGATDIAIKDGVFYINQAVDLIAVTIDPNTNTATVVKRIEDVFPEMISPDGFSPENISENEVVIGWQLKS